MKYNNIKFTNRPLAIPSNYRISYKISLICLIIKINSQPRTSVSETKIQMICNCLFQYDSLTKLILYCKNSTNSYFPLRYDPSLSKAINFAINDGLIIKLQNGNYKNTEKGIELVKVINKNNIFSKEVIELGKLNTLLTESIIKNIIKTWE